MLKVKTTTEKGTDVRLWLDEENKEMKGTVGDMVEEEAFCEATVKGFDVISFGKVRIDGETRRPLVKINKDIQKFLGKAKYKLKELKEVEKRKPVIFKVVKTQNSGWTPNWKVLDRKKKLLSDEQQDKIWELKSILGTTALFAGATKHIDVDDFPVEIGEEYTLEEIIELCEEHSQEWKQAKKEEKREEEHYEKCLEKAKRTGENVEMNKYSVHCNDPDKECNTDIITVYVTPSGKKKEERTHTY